ncbi:MAG: lyase family protein [archaeon]
MNLEKTKPKQRFPDEYSIDPTKLAAGRYGTLDMVEVWGPEQTFEFSLKVQGQSALTLSRLHPDIISADLASEISERASLDHIDPNRIRELEDLKGHDVIAINLSLEEAVSEKARPHINQARTSADTTQSAKSLQIKKSLEVITDTVENLRDILLEKSIEWIDVVHMDNTHGYDAVPSVAGRAFSHYAEMLQSGLKLLKFVYENSMIGKWGDVTGNHHSAKELGIDGICLQKEYCNDLGLGFMDAAAQVPGLEFDADVTYVVVRLSETINNIANYIAWGRSDDVNIFINNNPKKRKGSSGMPHKDAKNGNPIDEEQVMSLRNYFQGNMMTSLANCEFPYARNLAASANSRINLEDGFKFFDHSVRNLSNIVYWLGLREERCKERVERSYGVVTSEKVLTYVTDHRKVKDPMIRSEAHDLLGKLAKYAWDNKIPFIDVLLGNERVNGLVDQDTLRRLADPFDYIGESKEIVRRVYEKYHNKKTLEDIGGLKWLKV